MPAPIEPNLGDLTQVDVAEQRPRPAQPRPPGNRPRKPWIAFVLGILCAPAAFAYVGRYAWAIGLYALIAAAVAIAGWSGWIQSYVGIWTLIGIGVAHALICTFLPWWFARAQRRVYAPRWYNRWYLYPVLVAAIMLPLALIVFQRETMLGYATFRIPSGSMAPTVGVDDLIVVDTRLATLAALQIGDIVVVESVRKPDELNLRRIVAMGGQHVEIDAAGTHVDGRLQGREHLQGSDAIESRYLRFPRADLAPDEVYLMGDNRGNSFDSRSEGPYERSHIHGKATTIWYSDDASRRGTLPMP